MERGLEEIGSLQPHTDADELTLGQRVATLEVLFAGDNGLKTGKTRVGVLGRLENIEKTMKIGGIIYISSQVIQTLGLADSLKMAVAHFLLPTIK
jgi:hypothetical protein